MMNHPFVWYNLMTKQSPIWLNFSYRIFLRVIETINGSDQITTLYDENGKRVRTFGQEHFSFYNKYGDTQPGQKRQR